MASLASLLMACGTTTSHGVVLCGRKNVRAIQHNRNRIYEARIRRHTADPSCAAAPNTAAKATTKWEAFAASTSGEWDGVTATFNTAGKPQALPEYYVPQAFRDWGVTIFDWQSQCSTRCDADGLSYTHRRMMPTVGCEADAVAFTSQQQHLFSASELGSTVDPGGSYSHGDCDLSAQDKLEVVIEHCLMLEPGQRVRVVHNLKRMGASNHWQVVSIDVHRERKDSEYNGKVELLGCGGGMETFAEKPSPLTISSLEGTWAVKQGLEFAFGESGACTHEDTAGSNWSCSSPGSAVLLPLGVWTSAVLSPKDMHVEVGVLLEDGTMHTASRQYQEGKLTRVRIHTLVRA